MEGVLRAERARVKSASCRAGRLLHNRGLSLTPRPVNQLFVMLGISSWKAVLGILLLPPVPLLLMVLIGTRLVLPRRGLGWLIVLTSVAMLWLSTCGGTARMLSQWLLRPPPALALERVGEIRDAVRSREPVAIFVLGGGSRRLAPEYGVSNLNEISMERLRYGLWLARETGAPVGFTGGVGFGQLDGETPPEAQIAARIAAQEFGRPLKWIEERSRDTRENAAYSVPLLKEQGIRRVVLVTHQAHMPRALRAFEEAAQGAISFVPAPVAIIQPPFDQVTAWLPSRYGYTSVNIVLHEALGLLFGA
jgi:uncharacterized SAM-binding protein YcdF (DUF218 family)